MAHIKNYLCLIILSSFVISCAAQSGGTDKLTKPDLNRFEIEEVVDGLDQPMAMDFMPNGNIVIVEKEGGVKLFNPYTNSLNNIAYIPVNRNYNQPYTTSGDKYDADDGMHGVVLDPDFENNGYIYFYYSPATDEPISLLTQYIWENGSINLNSKNTLLEWRTQRERCCHLGGGMVFDKEGNLYIATGDNSGGSINTRHGDSRRTSGNTNDLRGSILRIKPGDNGTYTIPEGNLFQNDEIYTRPEIYILGVRNPWRLSLDNETGWLYWGEVGPSTDEFNQARSAGNFGWPFFLADNKKYLDIETDYDTTNIINDSPYNTGLSNLPAPPVSALVWYDRNPSTEFPIPGSGSLSAVGGPFYRVSDYIDASNPFPSYYNGKWFVTDYVRGWIMVISFNENGNYKSMEEFLPLGSFTGIIDMKFSPDGDLYVLQYGHESYQPNSKDSKLFRISYNDGNRRPIASASVNKPRGSIPLNILLSTKGTIDYDDNIVEYHWVIESDKGDQINFDIQEPEFTINDPGLYKATLTVTDSEGESDSDEIKIIAGNEPPIVNIDFINSNKSLYIPGEEIRYSITIDDEEDQIIDEENISTWTGFLPNGNDLDEFIALLNDSPTYYSIESILGKRLIEDNNCYQCHSLDQTAVGPSFVDIADNYVDNNKGYELISNSIIEGSIEKWGSAIMPAHPSISQDEAGYIANYIFNSNNQSRSAMSIPLEGSLFVSEDTEPGYLIIKASYVDQGNNEVPSAETADIRVLYNPRIFVSDIDSISNMRIYTPHFLQPNHLITNDTDASVHINNIDLTNINIISLDIVNFDDLYGSDWQVIVKAHNETIGESSIVDMNHLKDTIYSMPIKEVNEYVDLNIKFLNKNSTQNGIELRSIKFN